MPIKKNRHFEKYNRPLHQFKPLEIVELLKHRELCLNENNGEFICKKDIFKKDIIDIVPKPTETVELLKYRELQLNKNKNTRRCFYLKCCKGS